MSSVEIPITSNQWERDNLIECEYYLTNKDEKIFTQYNKDDKTYHIRIFTNDKNIVSLNVDFKDVEIEHTKYLNYHYICLFKELNKDNEIVRKYNFNDIDKCDETYMHIQHCWIDRDIDLTLTVCKNEYVFRKGKLVLS